MAFVPVRVPRSEINVALLLASTIARIVQLLDEASPLKCYFCFRSGLVGLQIISMSGHFAGAWGQLIRCLFSVSLVLVLEIGTGKIRADV